MTTTKTKQKKAKVQSVKRARKAAGRPMTPTGPVPEHILPHALPPATKPQKGDPNIVKVQKDPDKRRALDAMAESRAEGEIRGERTKKVAEARKEAAKELADDKAPGGGKAPKGVQIVNPTGKPQHISVMGESHIIPTGTSKPKPVHDGISEQQVAEAAAAQLGAQGVYWK